MSGALDVLQMKEEDVLKFLAAGTHLGGTNLDFQMEQYIYKRKSDDIYIIHLKRTWEKLLLAARAIVAIENPADVSVISSRNTGQRAVLKFAAATGATPIAGRFTPGTFTNQIQAAFREPRLLVVTDPRADHQPLTEASYVNLPTIALCNTDSPLRYVDIAIPCNNKGAHSVGLMWWMLAREVLRMRGTISREHPWEVMPDLYFYRDPEEIEKEEQAAAEKAVTKEEFQGEWTAPAPEFTAAQPEVADWSEGVQVPSVPIQQFPTEDWRAQPATEDWSAAPTAQATELPLIQVDSVQRWMEDLKLMTDCECMCILQSKPISLEDDAQSELIPSSQHGPCDHLQLLLKRAWIISTELGRIGQKLDRERWGRVHSLSVRLTCHARSMINEYSIFTRGTSEEMEQFQKLLMEKCSELTAVTERCLHIDDEQVLKSMKPCVSETLSAVGHYFSQLLELALTREIQVLVRKIDTSDNLYTAESTTGNLFSLTQEGAPLCRIIAKEGGVVALFKICRQDCFRCLYPQTLRTLASICCVEEGIHQLEKVDGILCLADILTDSSHSEATRAEAAAVVAQITSPHLPVTQHLSSFLESMEEIVTALIKLCQEASSGEVFLLASAALANITFFDTMACEMLLQLNAIRILLEACADKQRVDTPYTRDQIVTILANMSVLEQCASDIIQEDGLQLLVGMLSEKPLSGSPAEVAACERVQQKAAVTLTRLSRDTDVAREAIRLGCMPRLTELCWVPAERNNSDSVLVACLAALRTLAAVCPEGLQDTDFQQLVKPRLVDSFLLCANMEESFV